MDEGREQRRRPIDGSSFSTITGTGEAVKQHGRVKDPRRFVPSGTIVRPINKGENNRTDDKGPVPDSPDEDKTPSDHKEGTDSSSIREADETLARLTNSVQSLESALRKFPPHEVQNAHHWARQWVPKAIVVCHALEASLTGPPPERSGEADENLMMRGELSARVIHELPWESLGAILGVDREHPSLLELSSKIGDFIKLVEAEGASQDASRAPGNTWEDAVEAIRELRAELESVESILATREVDNIAEVALDRRAPLDAGSLAESALRIGTSVLVCSMVGAPLDAIIFHEPLLSAGMKAGTASLIGSTTAELVNHKIETKRRHTPEATFGRCHDQLLTSLDNYCALTTEASREEFVVARAHLVMDAYAARLATLRLNWHAKDQYWATIEGLQNAINRGEAPQKLTVWRPRLWSLAQSLEDQHSSKQPAQPAKRHDKTPLRVITRPSGWHPKNEPPATEPPKIVTQDAGTPPFVPPRDGEDDYHAPARTQKRIQPQVEMHHEMDQ